MLILNYTISKFIITGLKTGQVVKIYLDNPFPAHVAKIEGSVRCMDVSAYKENIAIVSETGTLSVFDMNTQEKLQEFQEATSVAFNSVFENMMCFSGTNYLAIKVAHFPEYKQKISGTVIGHSGSKVYCLNGSSITTLEVRLIMIYEWSSK